MGDRRARSKKEVDYTESLTEREWLRAIGVSEVMVEEDRYWPVCRLLPISHLKKLIDCRFG